MKRILLTLALFGAVAFSASAAEPLLKMLPQESCGMVMVEMSKLWEHPSMKETLQKLQGISDVAELEQTGCRITDIDEVLIFMDGSPDETGFVGSLIRSRKAAELLKNGASPEVIALVNRTAKKNGQKPIQVRQEQVAGKSVVFFFREGDAEQEAVGVVRVAPDVLLVSRRGVMGRILTGPAISPEKIAAFERLRIPGKSAIWGVWVDPQGKVEEDDTKPVEGKIIGVSLFFGFTGQRQLDLLLRARLLCNTRTYASTMGMMIPGFAQLGIAAAFSQQPELGQQLLSGFRYSVKDRDANMSLRLKPETVKALLAFLFTEGQKFAAPPDPVPSDIPAN